MPVTALPDGLGVEGRALWHAIGEELEAAVGGAWELDARERAVLEAAARQADTNRALEDAIGADGVIVAGSAGQSRLNACVTELRQGRIALQKLLSELALPNEQGEAVTSAQRRARHAAQSRWRAV